MSDSTVSTASGMRSTGIISDDRTVAHGPIDRMATWHGPQDLAS